MNAFAYAVRPLVADLLSTLVFVVLTALKVDVRIAVLAAAGVGVAQVGWLVARGKPVAALQWLSLGLVAVFGAASFVTHDPRFVMVKPTVIYALVGAVMLKRGWMLRYMQSEVASHGRDLMVAFGYVWAGLMFATGLANAVIAVRAPDAWPAFIAIFPTASKAALFALQFTTIRAVVTRRIRAGLAAAA